MKMPMRAHRHFVSAGGLIPTQHGEVQAKSAWSSLDEPHRLILV